MPSLISTLLLTSLPLSALGAVSATEWSALNSQLDGRVVLPTDQDYAEEYVLWTATWDNVYPEAIIQLASEQDAVRTQQFLNQHDDMAGKIRTRNCRHRFVSPFVHYPDECHNVTYHVTA